MPRAILGVAVKAVDKIAEASNLICLKFFRNGNYSI